VDEPALSEDGLLVSLNRERGTCNEDLHSLLIDSAMETVNRYSSDRKGQCRFRIFSSHSDRSWVGAVRGLQATEFADWRL